MYQKHSKLAPRNPQKLEKKYHHWNGLFRALEFSECIKSFPSKIASWKVENCLEKSQPEHKYIPSFFGKSEQQLFPEFTLNVYFNDYTN